MRVRSLVALLAVWSTALSGCRREPVKTNTFSATRSSEREWVVDDDRTDCPRANFTSIQAAVTAAAPGDEIEVCPGTYQEQVTVSKDAVAIKARRESHHDPNDEERQLARGERAVVVDARGYDFGFLVLNASGVTIKGFLVKNAHEADIALVGSTFTTIRRNFTTASGHDGIELLSSNNNRIQDNVSVNNFAANACGINLTSGSQHNVVRRNRVVNNEWGIQIAGAATLNNAISENTALRNRGNGIRNVSSASGTLIEKNQVSHNGFAPSALTGTTGGGIRAGSGTGIVVTENVAVHNLLVDLRQDPAAVATFKNNR